MDQQTQGCLGGVLLVVILGLVCAVCITPNDEPGQDTLSEEQCLTIYSSQTTWLDTDFDRLIKAQMNDPDSFEKRDTKLSAIGVRRVIKVDFTGRNAFGGTVRHTATGTLNLDDCSVSLIKIE